MSWLDDLINQISQNGSDAVPSEPDTSSTFNAAKDSEGASKFFDAFFGRDTSDAPDSPDYASAAKDSQRANEQLGIGPDLSSASLVSQEKSAPSFLEALGKRIGLKQGKDGSIDWSDPSTINAALKLIGAGANLTGMLIRRGQPEGYKSPADLRASVAGAYNNWTPQQQASANAFFSKPMQGGNHALMFAAQMPNPIVPGKGYAAGGTVISPASVPGSLNWADDQYNRATDYWKQQAEDSGLSWQDFNDNGMGAQYGYVPGVQGYAGANPDSTPFYNSTFGISTAPGRGSYFSGPQGSGFGGITRSGYAPGTSGADAKWGGTPGALAQVAAPSPTWTQRTPDPTVMAQLRAARRDPGSIDPNGSLAQYLSMKDGKQRFDMATAKRNLFGGIQQLSPVAQSSGGPQAPQVAQSTSTMPVTTLGNAVSALSPTIVPFSDSSPSRSAYGMRGGGRIGGGFARGGALGHVVANTGGQDDVVPINAAGGEYMMDADTVSALGDGNNAAGAKKLDTMRENVRAHKRSAPKSKIPPRAKTPEQYMKGGK